MVQLVIATFSVGRLTRRRRHLAPVSGRRHRRRHPRSNRILLSSDLGHRKLHGQV